MTCHLVQRHVGAYVDGELDPGAMMELERHIEACAPCQERVVFEQSYREHVEFALGDLRAPGGLEGRVRGLLDQAEQRDSHVRLPRIPWRQVVPLTAAAAVLLSIGGAVGGMPGGEVQQASAMPIFEDVVRLHSSALPADVQAQAPSQVTRYFRDKVEFPVRPVVFDRRDARLLGGRLSNVRERRAAALYYEVQGRRVTLVVFNAPEVQHDAFRMRFQGQDIFYRDVHGYPVPVRRYGDLNYAFTGDLGREALMRLAASARVTH